MAIDAKTLAAAKKYTDTEVAGGGAIKGKNCTVDSIAPITGGNRVTFKWTLDNGTVQTGTMDVMDGTDGADGADGRGIVSVDINGLNHLIVTYDDSTTQDAGLIPGAPSIQKTTMPSPSLAEKGNVYQYIGLSDANYTHGYFYECVDDSGVYKWEAISVQAGGGGGVNRFKDLDDVSFSNLQDGDLPVFDATTNKWKNSNQIPLDIDQLKASDLTIKLDIQNLQGSMANKADRSDLAPIQLDISQLQASMLNKVDKEAGKGLSEEDFTTALKNKLAALQKIYQIGSGLNLDPSTGELTATGAAITIDTALDPTSVNAVQNQAIAIPIQALEGSMLTAKGDISQIQLDITQLQGSVLDKADKSDITRIDLDISQLQASMLTKADKSDTYTKTEVDNIAAALKNGRFEVVVSLPTTNIKTNVIYLVPKATPQTDNIYDEYVNTDGTTAGWEHIGDTQIDLSNYIQKSSTAGLVKNDGTIDTNTYVNSSALDSWVPGTHLVDANGKIVFDNLDDTLTYGDLSFENKLIKVTALKKDPGTTSGTIKLTYTTDAPQNTSGKLRILK